MPRTLASAVHSSVSATARHRGEAYFAAGRVSIRHGDAANVAAAVRGTRLYDVTLRLEEDRLAVCCTCPFFEDSDRLCKHIWATVLAADRAGGFQVPDDLCVDADDDVLNDPDRVDELDDEDLDDQGDQLELGLGINRLSPAARKTISDRMKGRWAEYRRAHPAALPRASRPPPPPVWQTFLAQVAAVPGAEPPARSPVSGELIYVLDLARSPSAGGLLVELMRRERKRSGGWSKPKLLVMSRSQIARLPDERDRQALDLVCGAAQAYSYGGPGWGDYGGVPVPSTLVLNPTLQRTLAPRLCATGRLLFRSAPDPLDPRADPPLIPVEWGEDTCAFVLRITGGPEAGYRIEGTLRTGGGDRTFAEAMFITGVLIFWLPNGPGEPARLTAFETGGADRWITRLLETGPVTVPASEAAALVGTLAMSNLAHVDCPDELRVQAATEPPQPVVRITRPAAIPGRRSYRAPGAANRLEAKLAFVYGEHEVDPGSVQPVVFDPERRMAWRRDRDVERAALVRLQSLGVRQLVDWPSGGTRLDLADTALARLVRTLLAEGWRVEADGHLYRRPGAVTLDVRSGVDWFELHGGVDFDGITAGLPALLAAARRGDGFVPLGDGTFGLVPEDWLARAGRIAAIGTAEGDHVRFAPSQAGLLDAWLATQPAVSCDQAFARARGELARFEGVVPLDPPPGFLGVLRDYQRDALGWFQFLRRFGFGGCLADEMGLGKTVMVLAALEARRLERASAGQPARPSLIVVPRSLVFNWQQEAARFTPALRVLDCTAAARRSAFDRITAHDVVLTTYGTLRKDIGYLKDIAFDYAILDEAQAIKNVRTTSAKAARLLTADHRLALSGTPVENHLGELWSLFDFLNPGVLGAASIFGASAGGTRGADDETLSMLARGLRPFILRRTKEQVATELPARTEQTLYCDLEPPQRALYNQLRDHYRAALLGRADGVGLGRAKLQILEALLRLRQAACHPGLIDRTHAADPSAKLDMLVPRLQELVEDGRKVLVFSQFTSLLALLRVRLDEAKLRYEYLDGKTRDRAARVERFQSEAGCPLFLISLKAGGLGLNLTAAEYVFLLDPWWNPAVEAQAIDRSHRIGQKRAVFAFRLIARDTVEEKVLELQAGKRKLADAIVRADSSLIQDLRREDLELLLS